MTHPVTHVAQSIGEAPLAAGTSVELAPPDAAHAARVLRLSAGDRVILCDGRGYEYEATLEHVSPRRTTARIVSHRMSASEPSVFLTLVQGIAKGSKMDLIIQKAVEVGVSRIIPVMTERTVVHLVGAKADARVERWQRIAYEAAKQAGRAIVPVLESIVSWSEVWRRDDLGAILVPWEGERERGLRQAVKELSSAFAVGHGLALTPEVSPASTPEVSPASTLERRTISPLERGPGSSPERNPASTLAPNPSSSLKRSSPSTLDHPGEPPAASQPSAEGRQGAVIRPSVTIVIGPEGGLTPDEIALAREHGAKPVTLGPRILRTETAGLVAAALVLGALGDLG